MAKAGPKIMVAGHLCLDVTPVFLGRKVAKLSETLAPGKLIQMGPAETSTGGAVANTGLGLHVLGGNVRLVGKIGRDAFGQVMREKLAAHGAELALAEDDAAATSYTVVLAVPGVDRVFLHHPGANDTFRAADVSDAALAGVSHFHFGYPPLMAQMYANNGEELVALFRRVKEKGITTSLDLAAVDPAAEVGRADWRGILTKVVPLVDFFVPSAEELCYMLDRPRYEEWNRRAAGADVTRSLIAEKDIRPLADQLMAMGAKVLMIKCGAPGIYYRSAEPKTLAPLLAGRGLKSGEWASKEGFEASYLQRQVRSGTGAGDTSIAAFLLSMLGGAPFEKCVKLACATGAVCVSAFDALSGLQPLDVLWQRIEAGWEKEQF